MKKLMIAAAIVCAAVMSQAAAVAWDGFDIMDIDGNPYSGDAVLHCVELSGLTASGTVSNGDVWGDELISDDLIGDTTYHFYFTSTDSDGNTYQSATVAALAPLTGSGSATFEGGGTWTAVPEPTSGLLLLLGVAGLALKRKRA